MADEKEGRNDGRRRFEKQGGGKYICIHSFETIHDEINECPNNFLKKLFRHIHSHTPFASGLSE